MECTQGWASARSLGEATRVPRSFDNGSVTGGAIKDLGQVAGAEWGTSLWNPQA